MDFSSGACQHSLALECIPPCPLVTALLASPWVSASCLWHATTIYATHPGLPAGPWREHQCGPSAADAPAAVQMPAGSATVALGAAQLYLVDAPASLVASALKCGPLSNCLIAPRVGQVCRLLPAQVPLLSSSPTTSFGVPQSLLVQPISLLSTLRPAWQQALSIVALCQTAW